MLEESSGGEATTAVQNVGRGVTRSMEYTRWSWMVAMHTGGTESLSPTTTAQGPRCTPKRMARWIRGSTCSHTG